MTTDLLRIPAADLALMIALIEVVRARMARRQ